MDPGHVRLPLLQHTWRWWARTNLNSETKRLECVNIVHIDSNMVREYDRFVEKLSDVQVDLCQEILAVRENGLLKM